MVKDEYQPFLYFIASSILCYGFLLVLINGYYHFTYNEFVASGRHDLIGRLGFLTYATGALFYPSVLGPVTLLTWLSKRIQKIKTKVVWVYSLMAIVFIGSLFYTGTIDKFIYGKMENWVLGIVLIGLATLLYWNKALIKKI